MPKIIFISLILLLIIAAFISMQIAFDASPVAIGRYLVAQVGSAIGVTVSVPANPFNILAQQLKEKESALSEKEKEFQQREATALGQINKERGNQNKILIFLGVLGGILLALILLNFYFDWRRKH